MYKLIHKTYHFTTSRKSYELVAKSWRHTHKANELYKLVKPTASQWKHYSELRTIQQGLRSEDDTVADAAAKAYDDFVDKEAVDRKGIKYSVFAQALMVQREVRKFDRWEWD